MLGFQSVSAFGLLLCTVSCSVQVRPVPQLMKITLALLKSMESGLWELLWSLHVPGLLSSMKTSRFLPDSWGVISWKGEVKTMTMRRQSCLLSPVLISVLPLLINAKWKNTVHIRKGLCKRPWFKQDCSLALYYLLNSLGESSGFANSCWREHVPS